MEDETDTEITTSPAETTDTGGERAPSIRDALNAAFDAPADVQEPVGGEEPKAGRPRDETGRFAKGKTEEEKTEPATKVAKAPELRKPGQVHALASPPVVPVTPAVEVPKAPQSWKPLAREKWAALPEEARAEVLRREKEISDALNSTKADRDFASTVRQTVAPFEAAIRAEGSTPEKAIGNLLQTAMALRTSPPHHKAALVAGIIRDYGVPLEGLVAALQGQPVPQQTQHQGFDPATIAQQVQEQIMARLTEQRTQALAKRSETEASAFLADKEFSDDLREDMADIMERAAKRGAPVTLQQAYDRAAREHPEISKVVEQRAAAARAAKASASTQRSRIAASSVRTQPATTPVQSGQKMGLRESLEAAFDATR